MAEPSRILLVDDEPDIVMLMKKRLESEGFEVVTAADGEEALTKARSGAPHLIILDLMLPKLDGYKVCTMLKRDARYQKIPIMIFTARAQEKDEALGLACGADAFIRKPFQAQELLAQIRQLLAKTSL